MDYLGSLTGSIFSMVFIIFLIGTVGYLLGAISVKGISLGTAGVLLAALLYGILPLGWTGWISLQSKGLSRVFSNTTVQKHQFFCAQLSL